MNEIMRRLDELFKQGKKGKDRDVGLVLWVFPYHDHDGRVNYISNGADRKDIIVMMKELIARFEGQPEIKGRA